MAESYQRPWLTKRLTTKELLNRYPGAIFDGDSTSACLRILGRSTIGGCVTITEGHLDDATVGGTSKALGGIHIGSNMLGGIAIGGLLKDCQLFGGKIEDSTLNGCRVDCGTIRGSTLDYCTVKGGVIEGGTLSHCKVIGGTIRGGTLKGCTILPGAEVPNDAPTLYMKMIGPDFDFDAHSSYKRFNEEPAEFDQEPFEFDQEPPGYLTDP
ncbi:hypothetical protein LTR09_012809 [Extremus antarcticus]|uniref:Uncharacterized protein n=1 Tax=Extremus antarcticus TaxID=702011 RepID=A0AAJ0D9N8_9PEZI|nr:hypothetical protein LTR09_012809 [Extremus antarcticus]